MGISSQTNNLQNSNNRIAQSYKGANIGIMFNFMLSSNRHVPLQVLEPIKIPIVKTLTNSQLQLSIFIGLISTILLSEVISNNISTFFNVFFYIFITGILSVILFLNYSMLIIAHLQQKTAKGIRDYILLYDSKIEIHKNDDSVQIFDFNELRQILIKKNFLIGYTVYLYKKELLNSQYFNVIDFDEAFAIKDVIDNYIFNIDGNIDGNKN